MNTQHTQKYDIILLLFLTAESEMKNATLKSPSVKIEEVSLNKNSSTNIDFLYKIPNQLFVNPYPAFTTTLNSRKTTDDFQPQQGTSNMSKDNKETPVEKLNKSEITMIELNMIDLVKRSLFNEENFNKDLYNYDFIKKMGIVIGGNEKLKTYLISEFIKTMEEYLKQQTIDKLKTEEPRSDIIGNKLGNSADSLKSLDDSIPNDYFVQNAIDDISEPEVKEKPLEVFTEHQLFSLTVAAIKFYNENFGRDDSPYKKESVFGNIVINYYVELLKKVHEVCLSVVKRKYSKLSEYPINSTAFDALPDKENDIKAITALTESFPLIWEYLQTDSEYKINYMEINCYFLNLKVIVNS